MPKNQSVEYDATEPAFLRRLKAGHAALDGRNNVQIPRARAGIGKNSRLNMAGEEGEDDPIMLDDTGNVVSKEDFKALEKDTVDDSGAESKAELGDSSKISDESKIRDTKELHVSSGFGKKRKAVKVLGNDEGDESQIQEEGGPADDPVKSLKDSTRDLKGVVAQNKEDAKKEAETITKMKKGKKKKIKLSFDDPE